MRRIPSSTLALVALVLGFACRREADSTTVRTERAEVRSEGTEPVVAAAGTPAEQRPPSIDASPAEEPPSPPTAAPRSFADTMRIAHDRVRSEVRPTPATPIPPLAWDPALARLAQAWADSCPSGHRPDNAYGENIFWAGGQPVAPGTAVESWADEARHYDYESTVCSRNGRANWAYCGHYTQVVWRETERIGCGIRTDCPGDFQTVIVCNYDPPGNVNATARRIPRPY